MQKLVTRLAWLLSGAAAVLFAWGVLERHFTPLLAQTLLSAIGLAIAAGMTSLYLRPPPTARGLGAVGLSFIAASQVACLLLVWTDAKQEAALWRIWWAAAVPSLAAAHLRLLRLLGADWRSRLGRITASSIVLHGLLWIFLVLRRDILADPPGWYVAFISVAGGTALVSSLAIFERWRRSRQAVSPWPAWARWGLLAVSQALLFLAGLYVGRITAVTEAPYELFPSALAGMPPEEVELQVRQDAARLRTVEEGIEALSRQLRPMRDRIEGGMKGEGRAFLRPVEDDELRAAYMSFLSYRSALLRLVAVYSGFEAVHEPALRARCFLVAYAAATLLFETGGRLVVTFQDWDIGRKKLNEPDGAWGIPAGMFDRISAGLTTDRNVERFEEMAAFFEQRTGAWRAEKVWDTAEYEWFDSRIRRGIEAARTMDVHKHRNWLRRMVEKVKDDAYSPVYAVQSTLSEWIGDTRIVTRPPLISLKQLEELRPRLQPGDIILERRNFFLSNAFLPGFWPHGVLYVGTEADLKALGIADDPVVISKLEAYRRPAVDGKPCVVMEAVSEGVIFNSLEHSLHADHIAILRPRVSRELKAQAIVRAFSHQGKPYDFEFDFFTSDKLVCTELVYRAYEGVLHFQLQHIMGRDTLPAIEIVRKFARERGSDARELDFIAFIDGIPSSGGAEERGVDDFCSSAERPREFQE